MFIYPIYNHNWRNISTIYIYITRLASTEIFSSSNKIHREVGRARDLSAPMYLLTHPLDQSPLEANLFSTSQEIPLLYGTRSFITTFTRVSPMPFILNQIYLVHASISRFLFHFSIILPSTPGSLQVVSFPQVSLSKTCVHLCSPPYVLYAQPISFSSISLPEHYWLSSLAASFKPNMSHSTTKQHKSFTNFCVFFHLVTRL